MAKVILFSEDSND